MNDVLVMHKAVVVVRVEDFASISTEDHVLLGKNANSITGALSATNSGMALFPIEGPIEVALQTLHQDQDRPPRLIKTDGIGMKRNRRTK